MMAGLPSRAALEALKRVDLQKLCKDYGVKANLKSEALIDLLLDARSTPARKPSTRKSSRISSVIIHETQDDDDDDNDDDAGTRDSAPPPDPPSLLLTRSRKAKDTQTRLGVGRPVAAGGAGPRAVTKSQSVSRGKRAKRSTTIMKQTEATIPEEEPETQPALAQALNSNPEPSTSQPPHAATPIVSSLSSLADIDKHVADALRPIYEQMASLKTELEQMQSLKAELARLQTQITEMGNLQEKVGALTAQVNDLNTQSASISTLSTEFKQLKDFIATRPPDPPGPILGAKKRAGLVGNGLPSVVKATSSDVVTVPSGFNTSGIQTVFGAITPHADIASSTLGKRHRDSATDDEHETGIESELATRAIEPLKKRAKIATEQSSSGQTQPLSEAEEELQALPRIASFNVFSGPDEPRQQSLDPPPPTTHLSDIFPGFGSPSGSGSSALRQSSATTTTANASENQRPFSFSFIPASSTSAQNMSMPSFPYPEPPQSPSPVGTNAGAEMFFSHQLGERTDIFQSFGLPPPGRPHSRASESQNILGGFVNPASLTRRSSDREREKERDMSNNNVAAGLDLTAVRTSVESGFDALSDAPPMKRTMYGTELDSDTRFGDFGVEGVANTYWTGGRF